MKILPSSWLSTINNNSFCNIISHFFDSIFRGIGQVMFQNNPLTGFLFLCGIFYNSTTYGLAALLGTIIGTASANILKYDKQHIRDGFFGFNGTLVAIAISYFLETNLYTWIYLVFATIASTLLMQFMLISLKKWKFPTLTAPFVFTTLFFLLTATLFKELRPNLQNVFAIHGDINLPIVLEAISKGIAQVFFQENNVTGIIFAIGLFINSKPSFLMALIGPSIGASFAWLLDFPLSAIQSGAFGFNPALTAIALGAIFYSDTKIATKINLCYVLFGIILTTLFSIFISTLFKTIEMPILTLPFVLATWFMLIMKKLITLYYEREGIKK